MNPIARQITTLAFIAGVTIADPIGLPATAQADPAPPCSSGQVQVSNGGEQAAA
jgi:hypothetical protein